MDFQKQMYALLAYQRKQTFEASSQITLGELIQRLEPLAQKSAYRVKEGKDESIVVFDFEYFFPSGLCSWRGSYSELAITFCTYDDNNKPLTISEFLNTLKGAVGKTYIGYKGGNFTMSEDTPLWVANYGNSGNTGVVGVKDKDYEIIILTAYCEY